MKTIKRIKLSDVLPLTIWAIGLWISAVHIYGAALGNGALAEVAIAIPALFDTLVTFAAYVAIKRVREGRKGWSTWWPAMVASLVLVASLWINTEYVQPTSISEYLMTWAAVIGSFFAYELWRALQGDEIESAKLAVTDAVQAATDTYADDLARMQRRHERELAAARSEAAEPTPDPEPKPKASPKAGESAEDETRRLVAEYEAKHGEVTDRNELRKFIEDSTGLSYHTARKRLVAVGMWE